MAKGNEEIFSEENIPASNWMKFSKVGDFIKGTYLDRYNKPGQDDFKDQIVYRLVNCEAVIDGKKQESKVFSLGISKDFLNDKFRNIIPGQRIGLKFDKELPATKKGFNKIKSLLPNVWGNDPTFTPKEEFTAPGKEGIDFD